MMLDVPMPRLLGGTGDTEEIRRYLFRLATYLREALPTLGEGGTPALVRSTGAGEDGARGESPLASFSALKSLIISSADLVEHFAKSTERALSGKYVAASAFGTYAEETSHKIKESDTRTDDLFRSLQSIISDVTGLENAMVEVAARLRTGLLYYNEDGVPVYGLEIGQRAEVNGEETFLKYARFTADRLSFYDRNGAEVAYIGDYKLFITAAEIAGDLTLGEYLVSSANGLAFRYVGGNA